MPKKATKAAENVLYKARMEAAKWNDNANSGSVIAVIVTSSQKKKLPTHVPLYPRHGLRRPSTALCEHIITIDKSCLLNHMGTIVNTDAMRQLDEALKISLALKA